MKNKVKQKQCTNKHFLEPYQGVNLYPLDYLDTRIVK